MLSVSNFLSIKLYGFSTYCSKIYQSIYVIGANYKFFGKVRYLLPTITLETVLTSKH